MSWVRLDDRGAFHHKVMRAGNAAYGVWCRCLQMCGLNDSCGFVPRELALAIAGPDSSTIDRLTEVRLWVPVRAGESFQVTDRKDTGRRDLPDVKVVMSGDGFFVRDFLHFNRTESDSRSPAREDSDTGNVQETRAHNMHVHTVGRAGDARAPVAHHDAQKVRARKVHPPTRPDPTQPSTQPPLTPPPLPDPTDPIPDGPSGRGVVASQRDPEGPRSDSGEGVLSSPSGAEIVEPEPASASEQAVVDRLDSLGWRSKMRSGRFAAGWAKLALRIVREQGLTVEAIDELLAEAREKSRGDPMDLLGVWINPDKATWKDVLADRAFRRRHAAALKRGRAVASLTDGDHYRNGSSDPKPLRDIGPIYGET